MTGVQPSDFTPDGVFTPAWVCRVIAKPLRDQLARDVHEGRTVPPDLLAWLEAVLHMARDSRNTGGGLGRVLPADAHLSLLEEPRRLITYDEAGRLLGDRDRKLVQRLVSDGDLSAVYVDSRPRIHIDDLDAFLDAKRGLAVDHGGQGWTSSTSSPDGPHTAEKDVEEDTDGGSNEEAA